MREHDWGTGTPDALCTHCRSTRKEALLIGRWCGSTETLESTLPAPCRAPRSLPDTIWPGHYVTRSGLMATVHRIVGPEIRLGGSIAGVEGPQIWRADGTHLVHETDDLMRSASESRDGFG